MPGNTDVIQHSIRFQHTSHLEKLYNCVFSKKTEEYFQNVYFSQLASWLLLLLCCSDGVKVQQNLVASWGTLLLSLAGKFKVARE